MENNNGPVIIGGSIFVQNTTVLKNFQSLANAAKTAFIGFFDAMGFELDNIRFASGQTNQILFQIDENGKVVVVIMADIADSESIVEQWTKNLNQIAGRSFVMGMLARPNFPYIEAIQPKLERAQDGEKVSFRVDVVEMTERRAGEQTLTGRKVEWENPDDKVSLLRYIDGSLPMKKVIEQV